MSLKLRSILMCSAFVLSSQNVFASERWELIKRQEENHAKLSSPLSLITTNTHLTEKDLKDATLLISQKADVNKPCYFGSFPLHNVVEFYGDRFTSVNLAFMKLLLSNGAGRPMLQSKLCRGFDTPDDVVLQNINMEIMERAKQIADIKEKIESAELKKKAESEEEEIFRSHPSFDVTDRDIFGFSLDFKGIAAIEDPAVLPRLQAELKVFEHREDLAKDALRVLQEFNLLKTTVVSQILPSPITTIVLQYLEDPYLRVYGYRP